MYVFYRKGSACQFVCQEQLSYLCLLLLATSEEVASDLCMRTTNLSGLAALCLIRTGARARLAKPSQKRSCKHTSSRAASNASYKSHTAKNTTSYLPYTTSKRLLEQASLHKSTPKERYYQVYINGNPSLINIREGTDEQAIVYSISEKGA